MISTVSVGGARTARAYSSAGGSDTAELCGTWAAEVGWWVKSLSWGMKRMDFRGLLANPSN